MARPRSPFRPDAPVLWMDPKVPPHALAERHLLWPAWRYVVLAPHVSPRRRGPLNVIDEAFLRLLEAGQRSTHELERTLHLDRSLVAYVYADLLHRGLCDEHGAPTELGRRTLRDRSEREEEICHGHIFGDPTTGLFWGRFVERPTYAELEWRGKRSRLVLGPQGRARRVEALQVTPEQIHAPQPPRAEEVLREIEIHRRALAGGETNAREAAPQPAQLARISLVRARPEPVWLAVPLYATRVEDDGAPWHACDPFGIGSSPPLHRAVERRAANHPELAALLAELTREGEARRGAAASERARRALGARFGAALQEIPGLQGRLIDMQLALAGAEKRPTVAATARAKMREVLEHVLCLTLGDAGAEISIDLIDDREHDSALIAAQVEALGFEPPPHSMRRVAASEVRAAAERRSSSLRPLLAANALAAGLDAEHPLHALAARRPAFANEIDELADAHEPIAQEWDVSAQRTELERLTETTLDTVEWMLTTTRTVSALEV